MSAAVTPLLPFLLFTLFILAHAEHQLDRSLGAGDDVVDGDVLGLLEQEVASLGAALAAQDPRLLELLEDLLEISGTDLLPAGYILYLCRQSNRMVGDVK